MNHPTITHESPMNHPLLTAKKKQLIKRRITRIKRTGPQITQMKQIFCGQQLSTIKDNLKNGELRELNELFGSQITPIKRIKRLEYRFEKEMFVTKKNGLEEKKVFFSFCICICQKKVVPL